MMMLMRTLCLQNFSQPSRFATLQDQGDEEEHKKEDSEPTGSEVSNYITTES